jgi:integrase/recombinase XerC
MEGVHEGTRIRKSLKTKNRQVADKRLAELVRDLDANLVQDAREGTARLEPTLAMAAERFLASFGTVSVNDEDRGDIQHSTHRKYRTKLNLLQDFCKHKGVTDVVTVTPELLEDYHRTRVISANTWKVELQTLRTFFGYCLRRKWIASNPAKELRQPRNIKPNEVVPYTFAEEIQILAACDKIGGNTYDRANAAYEKRRARAMVMLLRHTALRVSDVCTLRKDAVSWDPERGTWRVLVRTQKSGEPVFLPIPEELRLTLDSLPLPRKAAEDCPYYFWNGTTARRAVVGIAERALASVFKHSGVKKARAHRFRHTLATRLLENGASFELVADILGNTPDVVRKHYGKWAKGRQDNIDRVMMAHFQSGQDRVSVTPKSRENLEPVN